MTPDRREDIYYAFRKARFAGFTLLGACAVVARELGTSERTVRVIVAQWRT